MKKVSKGKEVTLVKKTSDLYMKDGKPCGDMEAVGPSGKGPSGQGGGPKVGGMPMGVHHTFGNGIPGKGMDGITAVEMASTNGTPVKQSVLSTEENPTWGGKITPENKGVHNTFGVR
jgi:hypothetical protein